MVQKKSHLEFVLKKIILSRSIFQGNMLDDVISEDDEGELVEDTNVEDGLTSKKKKKTVTFNGSHVETILHQAGMFPEAGEMNGSYTPKRNQFTFDIRRRLFGKSRLHKMQLKRRLSRQIQRPNISRKLDMISRVAFPVMFLLYNIGYFIRYMSNEGEQITESI